MAGRPLKTFAELWRDASFEARREDHIARLDAAIAENTAPTDAELQPLLDQYERTPDTKRRYEVAKMIERACRQPTSKAAKTSLELVMHSLFGPAQQVGEPWEAVRRRQIGWAIWAMEHGIWWRAQRGCVNQQDLIKLAEMAIEADEDDVVDELPACRNDNGQWNVNALRRLERDLLAPYAYTLTLPHPDPPYAGE